MPRGLPVSTNSAPPATSSGTSGARPAPTGSGALFFETNTGILYFDNGTWQIVSPGSGPVLTPPPAIGAFTVVGNMGLAQVGSAVRAQMTSDVNSESPCALIASGGLGAAQSWIVQGAASLSSFAAEQFPEVGFGASNGVASGVSQMRVIARFADAASVGVHQEVLLVGTGVRVSSNAETTGPATSSGEASMLRMRLLADGVTLHYQYSQDGLTWWDLFTEATPAGFTNYGFALGNGFTGGDAIGQATIFELVKKAPQQVAVSGATNTTPIVLQTATPHNCNPGDFVSIHGVTGNGNANTPNVGGVWNSAIAIVVPVDATHLTLVSTAGNGAYTGGGTLTLVSR
jgi:hypothetical protein